MSQVIEIEQEGLQAAALALPTLLSSIPDPDLRMASAADPAQAANHLALEMRNHLLTLLPVTYVPMPSVEVTDS
jgi:hypothetical protein